MKNFLKSTPVLGFLFAFNLAVAVLAGFVLDFGFQQIATCAGMGIVSLGAGVALIATFRARRSSLLAPDSVTA